ncbi:hypothetical protein SAMN05421866_1319 [Chryseobacterium oranimense]|uniref:Lipoprotein n=1 Tax=Chryseobacterium oranimense TaxID=421058 RepID=A0A1M5M447_9FLAO|nr:hypothetical protein [Chryseobacterium oranimense]CEJ71070.1 hypothetical protein BN1195_03411 [Chryseobacterium oranimense G311]SHG72041.1 hypothetical protein SAMN05421866_1319 [Chryseobacterium oranimense]
MKKTLIVKGFLTLNIFCMLACSKTKQTGKENNFPKENLQNQDLKEFIGKRITVTGQTINMKLGALLIIENGESIWMEGMDSWPDGYYVSKSETKTVKVTGILTEKNDLPVFIISDSTIQQGIPQPEKTNLEKSGNRYFLKDYKYTVLK